MPEYDRAGALFNAQLPWPGFDFRGCRRGNSEAGGVFITAPAARGAYRQIEAVASRGLYKICRLATSAR